MIKFNDINVRASVATLGGMHEYTLIVASQDITQAAGVQVTQGSAKGTLKTALTGALRTTISIETAAGVTFTADADVVIGTGNTVSTVAHESIATSTYKPITTGGTRVLADAWNEGTINFNVTTLTVEAASHISSDQGGTIILNVPNTLTLQDFTHISADGGGSVRLVTQTLVAPRTAILSGLGGRAVTVTGHESVSIAIPSGTIEPIIRVQSGTFLVEGTGSDQIVDVNIQQNSQTENLNSFIMKNVRMLALEENAKIEMKTSFEISFKDTETDVHTMLLMPSSTITSDNIFIGVVNMTLGTGAIIHTDSRGYSDNTDPGFGCQWGGDTNVNRAKKGAAHGGKGGWGNNPGACPIR